MKKDILYTLNVFLYISLLYSCSWTPLKSSKIISIKTESFDYNTIKEKNIIECNKNLVKADNKNICLALEETAFELKEGEIFELLAGGYVTWAKSGYLRALKDKHNNLIKDLEGLKYSYIFSPIRFKNYSWFSYTNNTYSINDNNYKILGQEIPIAKIISFESTKEFEEKYQVKNLKLSSEELNIDFERYRTGFARISLKEISKEPNYIYSYNFGVFDNSLTDSFKLFYKKSKCNYMLAYLTIKNKQTNEDKTYEILLNIRLFNDTIRLIMTKYSNLSTEKLKLPIDE
ncbi:S2/P23 family protein [Borreliella americana]|uniref:S2/P23 family protein n=1 Tax=Borreliella americana TaxID=478807 RepID=UPI001E64E75E|nr:S2/P23 family protein [Borreliella americana]MCD2332863.1 S2/P23 family protein [Borreliella americana]MCD2382763.1 S2/P23 family protein [Borreliella americana]